MSIIKCKECGAEVSDKAKVCPKCGAPTPKKTSILTWFAVFIFVLIIFSISKDSNNMDGTEQNFTSGTSESTPLNPTGKEKINDEKNIQNEQENKKRKELEYKALLGASSIKKAMRDPDSLSFESVFITDNKDVCYDYRARNGFGGMNKEYAVLTNKNNFYSNNADIYNKKCTKVKGYEITAFVKHAPL